MRALLPLIALALVAGCPEAHDEGACGPVPGVCPSPCCDREPECVGDAWVCPGGEPPVSTCAPDPGCGEGCEPVSGSCADECCAPGGEPSCVRGEWVCPAGLRLVDRCAPPPECGEEDRAACAMNGECAVVPASCCATCGEVTLADVVAIRASEREAHRRDVCPAEMIACPPCLPTPFPHLQASCEAGRCTIFDVGEEHGACRSRDDCVVRVANCCECGGDTSPEALIALRRDAVGAYQALVCSPLADCATCAPVYPDGVAADCVEGRCAVSLGR